MGTLVINQLQVGTDTVTPDNNFVLKADGAGNLVFNTGTHDGTLTPLFALMATTFALTKAAEGALELPGGLLLKWGTAALSDLADTTITFPEPFPTACVAAWGSPGAAGVGNFAATKAASGLTANSWYYDGAAHVRDAATVTWFAVGY
jgi:hypothetical protein